MSVDSPYVVVVILTWNNRDILIECIESVLKLDYARFDVVVVDNHSEDGAAEMVKRSFPTVHLVENDKNYGAIKGKNFGFKKAMEMSCEYIFALDDDLIADKNALKGMIECFQADRKIGMAGAKIFDFEQKNMILSCGSKIDFTQNIVRQYGRGKADTGQYEEVMDVDFLGMGHTLIKREVIAQVGLLDESFLGYGYEDVDYGVSARKAGWRVVYCPNARVWHRPHSGVGRYTFKKKYLESRNAIVFMRKHARWHEWLKYSFFVLSGLLYALAAEGARGNIKGVYGKALGIYHGLAGKKSLALRLMNLDA